MTCAATIVRSFSARNPSHLAASILVWAAVLALMLIAGSANASTITLHVSYSATPFNVSSGPAAPVTTATGSFDITFDPTQTYNSSTAGISLISSNVSLDTPLCFSFDPSAGGLPGGLIVGGTSGGAGFVYYGTNDFYLQIDDIATAPVFRQLGYTTPSGYYYTDVHSQTSSVTVTPEPASLGLLALGSLALIRRRRAA